MQLDQFDDRDHPDQGDGGREQCRQNRSAPLKNLFSARHARRLDRASSAVVVIDIAGAGNSSMVGSSNMVSDEGQFASRGTCRQTGWVRGDPSAECKNRRCQESTEGISTWTLRVTIVTDRLPSPYF